MFRKPGPGCRIFGRRISRVRGVISGVFRGADFSADFFFVGIPLLLKAKKNRQQKSAPEFGLIWGGPTRRQNSAVFREGYRTKNRQCLGGGRIKKSAVSGVDIKQKVGSVGGGGTRKKSAVFGGDIKQKFGSVLGRYMTKKGGRLGGGKIKKKQWFGGI